MSHANVMQPLVLVVWTLIVYTNAVEILLPEPIKSMPEYFLHKAKPVTNIQKREATNDKKLTNEEFLKFIEKKLMQHTRALEHLLQVTQNNEDLTKKLIDNFSRYVPEPKMPDKLEVLSEPPNVPNDDNLFSHLGRTVPKYGNLVKNLMVHQVHDYVDPVPLVDHAPTPEEP